MFSGKPENCSGGSFRTLRVPQMARGLRQGKPAPKTGKGLERGNQFCPHWGSPILKVRQGLRQLSYVSGGVANSPDDFFCCTEPGARSSAAEKWAFGRHFRGNAISFLTQVAWKLVRQLRDWAMSRPLKFLHLPLSRESPRTDLVSFWPLFCSFNFSVLEIPPAGGVGGKQI